MTPRHPTSDPRRPGRLDPAFTQPAPRHTHETAPVLNIANVLTVVRIAFIPVFLWLMLGPDATWSRWVALLVFMALMITDYIDGNLARSRNLITDFGKIADPIADKALMISALVCLNLEHVLAWWVTVVIVVRELGITLWRMAMLRKGLVVPASRGGKLKTALQSLAVCLAIMPVGGPFRYVVGTVMGAAVIVTVWTGIQYLLDSRQPHRPVRRQPPAGRRPHPTGSSTSSRGASRGASRGSSRGSNRTPSSNTSQYRPRR